MGGAKASRAAGPSELVPEPLAEDCVSGSSENGDGDSDDDEFAAKADEDDRSPSVVIISDSEDEDEGKNQNRPSDSGILVSKASPPAKSKPKIHDEGANSLSGSFFSSDSSKDSSDSSKDSSLADSLQHPSRIFLTKSKFNAREQAEYVAAHRFWKVLLEGGYDTGLSVGVDGYLMKQAELRYFFHQMKNAHEFWEELPTQTVSV